MDTQIINYVIAEGQALECSDHQVKKLMELGYIESAPSGNENEYFSCVDKSELISYINTWLR